jgi:hypothetical protein
VSVNMHLLDRRLRGFAIAPVALILALILGAGSVAGIVLLVLAGVMAVTAATGVCPLYRAFHIDSRGRRPLSH